MYGVVAVWAVVEQHGGIAYDVRLHSVEQHSGTAHDRRMHFAKQHSGTAYDVCQHGCVGNRELYKGQFLGRLTPWPQAQRASTGGIHGPRCVSLTMGILN